MANFQYASDLHLEFQPESEKLWETLLVPCAKNLILAGDICCAEKRSILVHFLIWCKSKWERVIYVPGNHEYYGLSLAEGGTILEKIGKECAVEVLNPGVVEVDNVLIIGATMWSHIPDSDIRKAKNGLNDFVRIEEHSVPLHNKRFEEELGYLKREVKKGYEDGKEMLIVTHHVPSRGMAAMDGSDLTTCFGTDVTEHFASFNDKIKGWIYGHSHLNRRAEMDGIRVTCNQVGYSWKLAKKYGYKMDLVI